MGEKVQLADGDRVRRLGSIVFYLCLASAAGGILYAGATRDFGLGLKLFFGSLWALFANATLVTFVTGEFRVRGALRVRRARHPAGFYFVAILAAVLTLGPLSFVLWRALHHAG